MTETAAVPPMIVEAIDLKQIIAADEPVILSAQTVLEKGKEPGFIDNPRTYAVDEDLWTAASRAQQQLDDLAFWDAMIGALGIGDRQRMVVVYDNGALKFASRIRFLLAHYGIGRAVIVNGGWPAINLPRQPRPNVPAQVAYQPVVNDDPIAIATREDVRRIVLPVKDPNVTLIDVRTPGEFNGTTPMKGIKRPGHIPGAVNLPVEDLFVDPQNPTQLQNATQLRNTFLDAFSAMGVDPHNPMVFYCVDGARSSLAALAAVQASFPAVRLYYLSYLDWQSFDDDPIEK